MLFFLSVYFSNDCKRTVKYPLYKILQFLTQEIVMKLMLYHKNKTCKPAYNVLLVLAGLWWSSSQLTLSAFEKLTGKLKFKLCFSCMFVLLVRLFMYNFVHEYRICFSFDETSAFRVHLLICESPDCLFKEIQRLQEKLKERDQELLTIRERPEQEKEREIQQLRTTLAERDRTQATRTVLCNSLAEEADQLRAQLGATVQVCQELLGRLENEKNKTAMTDQRTQVHEVRCGNCQSATFKAPLKQLPNDYI